MLSARIRPIFHIPRSAALPVPEFMRGIVWDGWRLQLRDDLEVRDPGEGEVKLRVLASGICHSDLNAMEYAHLPKPIILGHEAAGVVAAIGPGVEGFSPGDAVMVSTQTPCRHCRHCAAERYGDCDATYAASAKVPFRAGGAAVHSFANVSSFAEFTTVRAQQLFKTGDLPPHEAALIGCAVCTGIGAARNLGRVQQGDAVLVLGIGGVGVNALQGARLGGATEIIAADINPEKETPARHFGATRFLLLPRGLDAAGIVAHLHTAACAPIDVAIECSGVGAVTEAAIQLPRRGGTCVLVGQPQPGASAQFDIFNFTMGRRLLAGLNGDTNPFRDFPNLIQLATTGGIDLKSQVTRTWPVENFEAAMQALRRGQVIRAVLDYTL
jgi:S-(hydroxymethyl)glutathione dehydrogenase/alcohol dehydrogenase